MCFPDGPLTHGVERWAGFQLGTPQCGPIHRHLGNVSGSPWVWVFLEMKPQIP